MKIENLIDGSLASDFILIHDTKDAKGELVLMKFINNCGNKQLYTHVLFLERNRDVMPTLLFQVYSWFGTTDHKKWLKPASERKGNDLCPDPLEVIQGIGSSNCDLQALQNDKIIVIIDSLSLLMMLYPNNCYKALHRLIHCKGVQLISLLHDDVLPGGDNTLKMFEQLATTNLIVSNEGKQSLVTIKHRKASGRVVQAVEQYYIDKNGKFVSTEVKKEEPKPKTNDTEWMSKDVTFKLELEDEEKRARSELVLPYLKASTQQQTSKIIYEPDASDDWDEEDPDDDLNI